MSEYGWRTGTRGLGADANTVGQELARLAQRGGLTPEAIVEAARNKRSALHPLIFDGTTAGDALKTYRLERASYILRMIEIREAEAEIVTTRAFHVVTIDGSSEYVTAETARDDPVLRAQVRRRLVRDLLAMQARLEEWDDFSAVAAAIRDAVAA